MLTVKALSLEIVLLLKSSAPLFLIDVRVIFLIEFHQFRIGISDTNPEIDNTKLKVCHILEL